MMGRNDDLAVPQNTLDVIRRYNFSFRKQLGQNFLVDARILDDIVDAADLDRDSMVLEIGPGIGTLTQKLAAAAGHVVAVEIDDNLIPILEDTLAPYDNVTIIHGDILKTDIRAIADKYNGGRPIHVVANLPYYITTPIVMGLFESGVPLHSVTVMVQKEVADRMQAGPGTKDYGVLSLAVGYYAEAGIITSVPPNCFIPRPKVGSAVIRLTRRSAPPVSTDDPDGLFTIIRVAFGQRRKTLANSLANAAKLPYSKETIRRAIETLGFSPTIRGEALSLHEFADLQRELEREAKVSNRNL
jgi:16S rRNA (adenine1518-N6/adenine1519-N6)-dimethyltransferase